MDTLMCQSATVRARIAGVLLFTALTAAAQTTPARPSWRRIGSAAIDLALASPATGPVSRVWFSADGSRLYALTTAGRVFESGDLETWSPAANSITPPSRVEGTGHRLYTQDSRRLFAIRDHLYRSEDAGV